MTPRRARRILFKRPGVRRLATTVLAVGIAAALGVVLAGHWDEFSTAMLDIPLWVLAVAIALRVAALVARSECWSLSVLAAGGTAPRGTVYRAAATGYVANIVNGHVGFAVRIAALRRAAPRQSPRAGPLATTEVPILVVEGVLAALFSFTLVAPLGVPWWVPLILFTAMLGALVGMRSVARRRRHGWWKGVAVMREAGTRSRIIGLVTLAMGAQLVAIWLLLLAVGADASPLDAAAVLIAVAVLGGLPIGPATGAGAAVLILGADGVGSVAAAGVLMTATSAVGALAYGAWAAIRPLQKVWRDRSRVRWTPRTVIAGDRCPSPHDTGGRQR